MPAGSCKQESEAARLLTGWLLNAQVRANFRPEFVNRIDEYIVFEGLKREQIKQIVRIQARRVAERLAVKKISLELKDSAVDYLAVRTSSLL